MADDVLKELLTSPVEERRKPREPREPREPRSSGPTWIPFVVAMIAGAAIALIAYLLVADDEPQAVPTTLGSTTTSTTTTTVAVTAPPTGQLPPGYTEVGDRIGVRPERILRRPDGVFITFTTAVVNTLDAQGTLGFQGGLWTLRLSDGTTIASSDEAFDPLARGTVSVFFPGDIDPDLIDSVELNGTATRTNVTIEPRVAEPQPGLAEGEVRTMSLDQTRWPLDEFLTLVLGDVEIDTEGGRVPWTVESSGPTAFALGFGVLTVELDEPIVVDETLQAQSLAMPILTQTGAANLFHPSVPAATLSSEGGGEITFDATEVGGIPEGIGFGVSLRLEAVWNVYEETAVTIDLDGVPTATTDA